jgi:phage baseplate assembly protein gpV
MQREHLTDGELMLADAEPGQPDALAPLLHARPAVLTQHPLPEVVIGELIAITDEGCTPLILYPGQPGGAALRAGTVLDLHGGHIGKSVVLSFENGDAAKPIVMGVLREAGDQPLDAPGRVQIDADGERMVVSAKEQMVLQCGKASITLTKAGKVLIQGSYVSSKSIGVNRLKGGSVQLN